MLELALWLVCKTGQMSPNEENLRNLLGEHWLLEKEVGRRILHLQLMNGLTAVVEPMVNHNKTNVFTHFRLFEPKIKTDFSANRFSHVIKLKDVGPLSFFV